MKILNKKDIFSIYANSTKVYANNTNYKANMTHFTIVSNIDLVPRIGVSSTNVQLLDEKTGKSVNTIGFLSKSNKSYKLSFESTFELKNDKRYRLILTDIDDASIIIYKGQLLVTEQDIQNYKLI